MENGKRRKKKTQTTSMLVNGLKYTWLILRTIFWTIFITLSLSLGAVFLCGGEPDINDDDLMREWLEKRER